ncbi:MAG: adenine deaminase C-terminal domain-containing protein, partial [Bilophila sp.]
ANLRRGSYVLIREGSAARNLKTLLPGVTPANARRCAFCCDDRHPADIVRDGHMDNHLRLAVQMGMNPIQAVTLCTLNAAECFGLRTKGAIAPGRDADFILVDDLHDFRIHQVFAAGTLVAEDGHLLAQLDNATAGAPTHSMHVAPLAANAFELAFPDASNAQTSLKVIGIQPHSLVTLHLSREVRLDAHKRFQCKDNPGLNKIAVIERHHGTGLLGLGLLEGYGLHGGAIATTIAHDSHNIVVAGDSDADMQLAVRELVDMGGGIVLIASGVVKGRLPLPIAGLMTSEDPLAVSRQLADMLQLAHTTLQIPPAVEPFMTLSFMALPVIPELKLTARGLFDVNLFSFVPIENN